MSKRPRKKKAKKAAKGAAPPSRCRCTGCDRCSPERGHCGRPPGDYADHQCAECHKRNADLWAQTQPLSLEIKLSDIVTSTDITPGTGSLVLTGAKPTVELSPQQRSYWKRILEKAYGVIPFLEVGVEVSPDGTVRIYIKPRA
jgi:hypothetical protein